MTLQLTHRDVWLDSFTRYQNDIRSLIAGDSLTLDGGEIKNSDGKTIGKLSKSFADKMEIELAKGWKINAVKVLYILLWHAEDSDIEYRIVLPEVELILN